MFPSLLIWFERLYVPVHAFQISLLSLLLSSPSLSLTFALSSLLLSVLSPLPPPSPSSPPPFPTFLSLLPLPPPSPFSLRPEAYTHFAVLPLRLVRSRCLLQKLLLVPLVPRGRHYCWWRRVGRVPVVTLVRGRKTHCLICCVWSVVSL